MVKPEAAEWNVEQKHTFMLTAGLYGKDPRRSSEFIATHLVGAPYLLSYDHSKVEEWMSIKYTVRDRIYQHNNTFRHPLSQEHF